MYLDTESHYIHKAYNILSILVFHYLKVGDEASNVPCTENSPQQTQLVILYWRSISRRNKMFKQASCSPFSVASIGFTADLPANNSLFYCSRAAKH